MLDIDDLTDSGGEQGLLGLAFSPDGTKAYINFTDNNGDTNVAELAVGQRRHVRPGQRCAPCSSSSSPTTTTTAATWPSDPTACSTSVSATAARGDPERRASNMSELLGKMLRIDPATPSGDLGYTIPADNPFVGTEGARGEIWSIGLRNPWRYSFDPETGDLWIADVGQNTIEEINLAPATDGLGAGRGSNFGWSAFEGSQPYNDDVTVEDHSGPIFEYDHSGGRCSISGGVRARGEGAGALAGWYVYADYCTGEVMALAVSGEGPAATVSAEADGADQRRGQVSAVASGPDGAVYVLTFGDTVYRIDPAT